MPGTPPAAKGSQLRFRVYGMADYISDWDYWSKSPAKKKDALGDFVVRPAGAATSERYYSLVKMKRPTGTILNADTGYLNSSAEFGRPVWSFTPHKTTDAKQGLLLAHTNRANVSFMDGHVQNGSPGDFYGCATNVRQYVTTAGTAYPASQWDPQY